MIEPKPNAGPPCRVDERIDMTGKAWHGMTFDGCLLVLRDRAETTTIEGCQFIECKFEGVWPDYVKRWSR